MVELLVDGARYGDIEDVIRHVQIPEGAWKGSGGRAVICDREALTKYATLTETTLVRMFDFTYVGDGFGGWDSSGQDDRVQPRQQQDANPAGHGAAA